MSLRGGLWLIHHSTPNKAFPIFFVDYICV